VTPPATSQTDREPGAPSLGRSEGMTFVLSIPARHWISIDRVVCNTIEVRCHAQAQSCTPERRGGGLVSDHFSPLAFGAVIWAVP
jgi:hypothetical protein